MLLEGQTVVNNLFLIITISRSNSTVKNLDNDPLPRPPDEVSRSHTARGSKLVGISFDKTISKFLLQERPEARLKYPGFAEQACTASVEWAAISQKPIRLCFCGSGEVSRLLN